MAGSQSNSSSNYGYSKPLTADEVGKYYRALDSSSGGKLDAFAKRGDSGDLLYQPMQQTLQYQPIKQDVQYQPLSDADIRAVGGQGAMRELAANQGRQMALEQVSADPRLSIFQSQRAQQLANRDWGQQIDAIKKESEASATGLKADQSAKVFDAAAANRAFAADQAAKAFDSQAANRAFAADQAAKAFDSASANRAYRDGLTRDDLLALAQIYFGGKGNVSVNTGKSSSTGWNLL